MSASNWTICPECLKRSIALKEAAELDKKGFHIGRDGKPIYEERYDDIGDFQFDGITWVILDGKEITIGRDGKRVKKARG